jgi:5-formyltetrahydrofolate cyclo-ligase
MVASRSSELSERKRALRLEMGERREALTEEDRQRRSAAAVARLLALPELSRLQGRTVAGYIAVKGEIDPAAALATVQGGGAAVALPRVSLALPTLRFHLVGPGVGMVTSSRFGLIEPEESAPKIAPRELAVMIVPGMAFDRQGRRLGFGGGYYDGVLAGARAGGRTAIIGLAYDFQIVDTVPSGEGDLPVDFVVTDERVVRPREEQGR